VLVRKVPFSTRKSRILGLIVVTLLEALGVYWWLRFQHDGHLALAFIVLVIGEFFETTSLAVPLRRARTPIPSGDPFGVGFHRRRSDGRFLFASVAELAIWTSWLWVATGVDLPLLEPGLEEPVIGVAFLLVTMHLKHQLEASTLDDIRYFQRFWRCTLGSIAEVAAAAGCLALIEDGKPGLAAGALGLGLLVEHWLLVYRQLFRVARERDISVPRLRRPPLPLFDRIVEFLVTRVRWPFRLLQSMAPVDRFLNWLVITAQIGRVVPRPNPLSTMEKYTSWSSLTDRTWSGRYLPPTIRLEEPPVHEVAALFLRDDDQIALCPKSTVLFTSFAQWFVDGFLRTQRQTDPKVPRDTRRNESGHDLDLAQLYGLDAKATSALRAHAGGRLASQQIDDEEFPPFLCEDGKIKRRYEYVLPEPMDFENIEAKDRNRLFAMGTDVHSIGFTAFNVLFLREHNKIAAALERDHPTWDDERLFQTARIILLVVLMKIIVEDYINHIAASYFQFRFPAPATFAKAAWFRQNWMAIEFNLLYRWHPLIPTTIAIGGCPLNVQEMLVANRVLIDKGLRTFMVDASRQAAGRMSLFNCDPFIVENADARSIEQARVAKLSSYNDYRELASLPRLRSFSEFSTDERVGERLRDVYGRVENVEFYVGLFAEQAGPYDALPKLMHALVAFDAFSQLLTNPLLAPRVFGPDTFTPTGLDIIARTKTLKCLILRNTDARESDYISLTREDYRGP
jgi:prostaglandin-endoperoxide synthase 2